MRARLPLAVGFFVLLVLSCGDRPGLDRETAPALTALNRIAANDVAMAALLAPREAFVRTPNDEIVSEGWRAPPANLEGLGARVPNTADGVMDVGPSRFSNLHLHVTLDGAHGSSTARVVAGRVVYPSALASADRVVVSNATCLEEFLVLKDNSAPRDFTWTIQLPEGIARVRDVGGAFHFEDAAGRPKIVMGAPTAHDGRGERVATTASWSDARRALTLTLPSTTLAYPVVVDPRYDLSVWFDAANRAPVGRAQHALAFDSARGEVVLFGGGLGTPLAETWVWGASGTWTQRHPPVSPSGRVDLAMAYDRGRGEVVLFGGGNLASVLGDTWVWNGAAGTWTRREPTVSPSPRLSHALAYDVARGEIVLFGGSSAAGHLNDTWVWNGTAATWTQRSPATAPPARSGHALAFDEARSEILAFGGFNAGRLNDTWTWDGAAWTQRLPPTSPPARFEHALAYDSVLGETLLFGGYGNAGILSDTWTWNGTTRAWTLRPPPTASPARANHAIAYDAARGEVVSFGGRDDTTAVADTWTWSRASLSWTRRAPLPPPPARREHAMAFDRVRAEVVLFGGTGDSGASRGDTWVWNGTAWSQRLPASSPTVRYRHALAFDGARGELVLFGGIANSGFGLSDTWVWNGLTWTQRTPVTKPSDRAGHAMAFDSAGGEVVLFGGNRGDDTWTWNGVTWTLRSPRTKPPGRERHGLAFDASRGEIVLFAGFGTGGYLDDTWVWSGATETWTQRFPPVYPSARYGHAMAFDTTRGDVIAFGGDGAEAFNDTWAWNGATWAQRSPATLPPARSSHALAFDSVRGDLVMFGGSNGLNFSDTWIHRTLGGTCAVDADCADTSFCTDGVCCAAPSCASCETCAGTSPGRCSPVLNTEDADTCAARDGKSCSNLGECKAALGATPATAAECASGYLVDGVCCSTNACGPCETCNVDLKTRREFPGVCSAARANTDPHDDCADEGAASCGRSGQCDGERACALYPAKTACATGKVCTGAGECVAEADTCLDERTAKPAGAAPVDCGLYRCERGACAVRCVSADQCRAGAACGIDGQCTELALSTPATSRCAIRPVAGLSRNALAFAVFLAALRGARRRRSRPTVRASAHSHMLPYP